MGIIEELFQLSFKFNIYTVILLIVYLGTIAAGYYLMAKQVKLVKKEIWDNADRFKSFIWGFFFGNSVTINCSSLSYFSIVVLFTIYFNLSSCRFTIYGKWRICYDTTSKTLQKYY
ncbi:MAG: hypothetical protein ACTSPA_15180 [Promethearchaeota archaeon]